MLIKLNAILKFKLQKYQAEEPDNSSVKDKRASAPFFFFFFGPKLSFTCVLSVLSRGIFSIWARFVYPHVFSTTLKRIQKTVLCKWKSNQKLFLACQSRSRHLICTFKKPLSSYYFVARPMIEKNQGSQHLTKLHAKSNKSAKMYSHGVHILSKCIMYTCVSLAFIYFKVQ